MQFETLVSCCLCGWKAAVLAPVLVLIVAGCILAALVDHTLLLRMLPCSTAVADMQGLTVHQKHLYHTHGITQHTQQMYCPSFCHLAIIPSGCHNKQRPAFVDMGTLTL
jgi:hypothetical protein